MHANTNLCTHVCTQQGARGTLHGDFIAVCAAVAGTCLCENACNELYVHFHMGCPVQTWTTTDTAVAMPSNGSNRSEERACGERGRGILSNKTVLILSNETAQFIARWECSSTSSTKTTGSLRTFRSMAPYPPSAHVLCAGCP